MGIAYSSQLTIEAYRTFSMSRMVWKVQERVLEASAPSRDI
jgi:hypothetical protein